MSKIRASKQIAQDGASVGDALVWDGSGWTPASAGGVHHGCRLYKSAAQSIPDSTTTALTWDSESWDTDALHSTSSNTSRITVPTGLAGFWLFTAGINFAANASGLRAALLRQNGSAFNHFVYGQTPTANELIVGSAIIAQAAAGDYFEVYVTQDTGAALNVQGGATGASWFSCTYLGS